MWRRISTSREACERRMKGACTGPAVFPATTDRYHHHGDDDLVRRAISAVSHRHELKRTYNRLWTAVAINKLLCAVVYGKQMSPQCDL